jgi:hypothetical protein
MIARAQWPKSISHRLKQNQILSLPLGAQMIKQGNRVHAKKIQRAEILQSRQSRTKEKRQGKTATLDA